METWMLWALISAIVGWFYSFIFKMIAQRNYDTYVTTLIWYLVATAIGFMVVVLKSGFPELSQTVLIIATLWFVNILFYTLSIVTRVKAMRNIDSVIFFPLYKTFWPIIVTIISYYGFKEWLSWKELLWILTWICVPLLLITSSEKKIQKNLYLGVFLVVLTAMLASTSAVAPKYVQAHSLDYELYLLFGFMFGIFFSAIGYLLSRKNTQATYETNWVVKFSLLTWILHYMAFYTFVRAMEGNFAIAFTINSFSLLIPIILSIVFYWEHFNLKKGIVILLSIVSILLFI